MFWPLIASPRRHRPRPSYCGSADGRCSLSGTMTLGEFIHPSSYLSMLTWPLMAIQLHRQSNISVALRRRCRAYRRSARYRQLRFAFPFQTHGADHGTAVRAASSCAISHFCLRCQASDCAQPIPSTPGIPAGQVCGIVGDGVERQGSTLVSLPCGFMSRPMARFLSMKTDIK